jgi:Putative beta-barrel porin-2, OmpL-like. bbp2
MSKSRLRSKTRLMLFVVAATGLAVAQDRPAPQPESGSAAAEIKELRDIIQALQARIDRLEARLNRPPEAAGPGVAQAAQVTTPPAAPPPAVAADPLHGTTLNLYLDGYYGWNFNRPVGRVNLLRAYDVSSNSFSLNQVGVVIESAPDPANGRRFGGRLDLQWGQATQTLQGNAINEPRPEVYRDIFQAYGTYVIPAGRGLSVDVGKFASSLGLEGNYTKDQINYSRSYWFNFLPFYHMGIRATYKFSDTLAASYWIVNGTQQTEAFNDFKDQFAGLAFTPGKKLTWNINYYLGQEHPDVLYFPNGGAPPGAPTQQGVPFEPIPNAPQGRLHIFDTYATWQAAPKFTLAAEADSVIQRLETTSPPARAWGGALYGRYQLTPGFAVAGRAEYMADRGGLFSGAAQALKETTFTAEYKFADGFLLRGEWRRDFSNQPYFLTHLTGSLKKEQNTATLGMVLWFGGKQGAW